MSHQLPLAVIFDFDGVVGDTLNMHLSAWCAAVRTIFGIDLEDPDKLRRHSTVTIAHILAKQLGDPRAATALIGAKHAALLAMGPPPMIKGARRLIDRIDELALPWGIASNSPASFVEPAALQLGIKPHAIVATEEPHRRKPRPDIFWDCANQLGIQPPQRSNVHVYEDSAHGVTAAIAAGMQPFGVVGAATAAELANAGALRVSTDLDDFYY